VNPTFNPFRSSRETMELPFTHKPGRRERHLRRRHENPLFAWPPAEVAPEDLLAAQRADHEEMEAFRDSFRALVREAVDLPPNAGSEAVLGLKEELERHYEQSFGLPEEHREEREAIRKLIDLIMKAVHRSASEDPLARRELADEAEARAIHFRLLEQPLVADMLHPDTPIGPGELPPSVLCAGRSEVDALLEVLDPDQVALLAAEAENLLTGLEARGVDTQSPRQRLALLEAHLASRPVVDPIN
jgi:hypothetical protein